MSQATLVLPTTGPSSMATWVGVANPGFAALLTKHSGPTAPSTAIGGQPASYQWWVDTALTPQKLRMYAGSTWALVGAISTVSQLFYPLGLTSDSHVVSTAAVTLALSDLLKTKGINLATSAAFTIPASSVVSFPVGWEVNLFQYGAGAISIIAATTTVLIRSPKGTAPKFSAQYGKATARNIGTDEWLVNGDLST